MFCLSRFGFAHGNFPNYPFFLLFLRNRDPFTLWMKNEDMANWCIKVKGWFAYSCVVSSCLLPVKILVHKSNFHNLPIFPCFLRKKDPFTWWIKDIEMANSFLWANVWFSPSGVLAFIACFGCQDLASCIKVSQITFFPVFSQEKRPLHMVNQKHRYGQLIPVSQRLIWI